MKTKTIVFFIALTISAIPVIGQTTLIEGLSFSSIQGEMSKKDTTVLNTDFSKKLKVSVTGNDASSFKSTLSELKKGETLLITWYEPEKTFKGIATANVKVTNGKKTLLNTKVRGISTIGLEGENEPALSTVLQAFGIDTNLGWTSLANHTKPEKSGEELAPCLFKKNGNADVKITPIARYSPAFELSFGFYINSQDGPELHQVGVLSGSDAFHEHQNLMPAMAHGKTDFNPGDATFGIYTISDTHNSFQEDGWNQLLYPEHAGHAARIYPVKKAGKVISNSYLVCFEEASNGDYQDYVFLLENVEPVYLDTMFTDLFANDNLSDSWYKFIESKGKNNDPDNIFTLKDGILHVTGQEMGYIMTNKVYKNYHFSVEFKWGEKRWPPRENVKRDSGICYHIPEYAPDQVWPWSVECQIQEGDTGDFWLLGYSTIEVDGKQNLPKMYSNVVKKTDNEKPRGEWNTVEVITYNGICVHRVNGVVVNYGRTSNLFKGKILLQSELAELDYRNVKIREF
ncbi:3-keto-disaccharide hydrolase [Maribacter cobaltidurans]|nr:DUF1080 domain-containing protein [Maribacter cobaltidurans]